MEKQDVLDLDLNETRRIQTLGVPQFMILHIATLGLYQIWWFYKIWRHFRDKEHLDILPVWRAIFSIFFFYSLADKIQGEAGSKGYLSEFSPGVLTFVWIVFSLLGYLPVPFALLGLLAVLPAIPVLQAFNYYLSQSAEYHVEENNILFSGRQIVLLLAGGMLWFLILIGLSA